MSSPKAYGLTALAAGIACALLVWLPRRLVWLLPVIVGAVFVAVSVSAAREFADQSRVAQRTLVGAMPDGIDRNAGGPVTYLYDGGPVWGLPWQEVLWNDRIDRVLDLTSTQIPGPLPQSQLRLIGDGGALRLVDGKIPTPG